MKERNHGIKALFLSTSLLLFWIALWVASTSHNHWSWSTGQVIDQVQSLGNQKGCSRRMTFQADSTRNFRLALPRRFCTIIPCIYDSEVQTCLVSCHKLGESHKWKSLVHRLKKNFKFLESQCEPSFCTSKVYLDLILLFNVCWCQQRFTKTDFCKSIHF